MLAPLNSPETAQAAEFSSEFEEAVSLGKPVEIVDARTATDTVFANPEGTMTREIASAPIRVSKGDEWVPIDLDLEVKGGVVVPKASPIGVELSAGGDTALASIGFGGVTTTTSWVDTLPDPVLDGPTATYPEVFEGVDLRMTATDAGVTQVLVVKSAAAADNPEQEQLSLPTQVEGGEIEERAGAVVVLDDFGREVGASAAPTMWDSSGTLRDAQERLVPDESADGIDLRGQGPAVGDDVAPIDLVVNDDNVVLRPDSEALAGAGVTYPVFVDPAHSPSAHQWAMAFAQHPSTSFYKWTDSNGQAVGYQNYSGTSLKRIFFRFDISKVARTEIISASLRAGLVWSSSCEQHATRVYKVGPFDSTLTWNKQPEWREHLASASATAFHGCDPGGRDVYWNIKSGVADSAAAGNQTIALGLRAADEQNPRAWRRYRHTAKVSITYNRPPSTPTNVKLGTEACNSSKVLKRGPSVKLPTLSAKFSDPDGDNVRVFAWNNGNHAEDSPHLEGPAVGSGNTVTVQFPWTKSPTATMPGRTYKLAFRARDSNMTYGKYAPTCEFLVDATLAAKPEFLTDPPDSWGTGSRPIRVGPDGGKDTVGYAYTVDKPTMPPAKNGDVTLNSAREATITVPPQAPGPHILRVWAYDHVGNPSGQNAFAEMPFEVLGPTTSWSFDFDEDAGPSLAADGTSFSVGGAERVLRRTEDGSDPSNPLQDLMLALTPQTGAVPQSGDSILNLDMSFSVAALVDPANDGSDSTMTAVSLGSSTGSGLEILAEPDESGFDYVLRVRDSDGLVQELRVDGDDGEPGSMLVRASYRKADSQWTLSLDGQESGTPEVATSTFEAPSGLNTWRLGARHDDTQRWNGTIDHFHLAQYVLGEDHVTDLLDIGAFADECVNPGKCD